MSVFKIRTKDEIVEWLQKYAQHRANNEQNNLSQFSIEELEEKIKLCKEDIKACQHEVNHRLVTKGSS